MYVTFCVKYCILATSFDSASVSIWKIAALFQCFETMACSIARDCTDKWFVSLLVCMDKGPRYRAILVFQLILSCSNCLKIIFIFIHSASLKFHFVQILVLVKRMVLIFGFSFSYKNSSANISVNCFAKQSNFSDCVDLMFVSLCRWDLVHVDNSRQYVYKSGACSTAHRSNRLNHWDGLCLKGQLLDSFHPYPKWQWLPAGGTLRSVSPASNRCHFVLLDKNESCTTADLSNLGCPSGPAYSTGELLNTPQFFNLSLFYAVICYCQVVDYLVITWSVLWFFWSCV